MRRSPALFSLAVLCALAPLGASAQSELRIQDLLPDPSILLPAPQVPLTEGGQLVVDLSARSGFDLDVLTAAGMVDFFAAGPFTIPQARVPALAGPPAAGDPRLQADMDNLAKMMALRPLDAAGDDALRRTVVFEGQSDVPDVFAAYGLLPERQEGSALWALIDDLNMEITWFVLREKMRWNRPAPAQPTSGLAPLAEPDGFPSYPSGQGGQAYALAFLIGHLDPPRSEEVVDMATQISVRREMAAMQYRSDTNAAADLARVVVTAFLSDPGRQEQIAAARSEFLAGM